MTGEQVFWICISGIIGVTILLTLPVVSLIWRSVVRESRLIELKRELVQQGYAAEDIERIVRAAPSDKSASGWSGRGSTAVRHEGRDRY